MLNVPITMRRRTTRRRRVVERVRRRRRIGRRMVSSVVVDRETLSQSLGAPYAYRHTRADYLTLCVCASARPSPLAVSLRNALLFLFYTNTTSHLISSSSSASSRTLIRLFFALLSRRWLRRLTFRWLYQATRRRWTLSCGSWIWCRSANSRRWWFDWIEPVWR